MIRPFEHHSSFEQVSNPVVPRMLHARIGHLILAGDLYEPTRHSTWQNGEQLLWENEETLQRLCLTLSARAITIHLSGDAPYKGTASLSVEETHQALHQSDSIKSRFEDTLRGQEALDVFLPRLDHSLSTLSLHQIEELAS